MKALPLSLKIFLNLYNGINGNSYVACYNLINKIKRLVNNMFTSLFGGATQI